MRGALQTSAELQQRAGEQGAIHRRLSTLTARELELLKLVVGGNSNKQIARRLGLSEKTVRNHLSRAFSKLGVTNRTEAVMSAMRKGLLTV